MAGIDLEKADLRFRRLLAQQPGGEKIMACFTCRTCTASCPVVSVNGEFNPLRIIRMALYGMREEVLGSSVLWLCLNCYACQERCPQGVPIVDILTYLRNLSLEWGNAPQGVKMQRDLIRSEGRIYPIDDFDNRKRQKLNLPPLPTSCSVVKKLFSEEQGPL